MSALIKPDGWTSESYPTAIWMALIYLRRAHISRKTFEFNDLHCVESQEEWPWQR